MRGTASGKGQLEGLGNSLDTVHRTEKSKMTEGIFVTGRLLPPLTGSGVLGRTAGWKALNLTGKVKYAIENN